MKTLTHIETVRREILTLDERVTDMLGWDWDMYTEHKFDEYCRFAEAICRGHEPIRTQLLYSPVFRGFWVSEWAARTKKDWMINAIHHRFDRPFITAEYLYIHNHEVLMYEDAFLCKYEQVLTLIRRTERGVSR